MPDEVMLTVRVPEDLLRHARSIAEGRDETVSQVVRRALRAYVRAGPAQLDLEAAVAAQKRGGGTKRRTGRR